MKTDKYFSDHFIYIYSIRYCKKSLSWPAPGSKCLQMRIGACYRTNSARQDCQPSIFWQIFASSSTLTLAISKRSWILRNPIFSSYVALKNLQFRLLGSRGWVALTTMTFSCAQFGSTSFSMWNFQRLLKIWPFSWWSIFKSTVKNCMKIINQNYLFTWQTSCKDWSKFLLASSYFFCVICMNWLPLLSSFLVLISIRLFELVCQQNQW